MGEMADLISDYADFCDDEPIKPVCRNCGFKDLHWAEGKNGWRLFHDSDGKLHFCLRRKKKENVMRETDFKVFWILWQPASNFPPRVRFATRNEAYEAAEVMARRHSVEFYVLRSDGKCELDVPPLKWTSAKTK